MENKIKQNTEITDSCDQSYEKLRLVSRFCRYSLILKWHDKSTEPITSFCPFCWLGYSTRKRLVSCSSCLVPNTICGNFSSTGFISELRKKYSENVLVGNLTKDDLNKMISLFAEHIIEDDDNDEYELVIETDGNHVEVPI
jgi:hypothetical protein